MVIVVAVRQLINNIWITSQLATDQRSALEQLLFFNENQHRVRGGILQSIDTYGVPEIHEHDGVLGIRVGAIAGVQSLFAVTADGRPRGVAVFVRLARNRIVVLHLGVEPSNHLGREANPLVLIRLMHEVRSAARCTRGVDRIELVYKSRAALPLHA